ncbi:MAG TPA: glycoside hydrolase domain-containing protein [Abditibacteriaceae bacterium]
MNLFRSCILRLGAVAIATALCYAPVVHAAKAEPDRTTDWQIHTASSLQKLTATAPGDLEPFSAAPIHLQAARGEWESFQVVVTAGDVALQNVALSASGFTRGKSNVIASDNIQLFRENYVYIDKPSGNRRLEKLWWPDALIPLRLQPTVNVAARRSVVFWVAVQVPRNAAPGEYSGKLVVATGTSRKSVTAKLTVASVTMPPPTMRANVAVYYDVVRDWYAKNWKPLDDAQFAATKKQYYDFLLDYRLNAYDLPVAWNSEAATSYLRDSRVLSVRLPHLSSTDFAPALEQLKKTNTLHKAYYYHIDEPAPERYAEVRDTTQKLHGIDPRVKHLVTAHPNQSLKDAVDIWCPNIGDHFGLGHLDLRMLEAERKKGRETWWYTMVEPKNPYPTWLVDDDAAAVRVYGWMMARYGITGFVYSMAHGWGPKPLENIQSFAGTNGDGTLLYPSELVGGSGPMPSIRLILLRDAIEDYELLRAASPTKREVALTGFKPINAAEFDPQALDTFALTSAFREDKIQWLRDVLIDSRLRAARASAELIGLDHISHAVIYELLDWKLHIPLNQPIVNGRIDNDEWPATAKALTVFEHPDSAANRHNWVSLNLAHDKNNLYVALRCRTNASTQGEWVAVDLAPFDAHERWRFVLTQKGNRVVERHTREGQFRVEGVNWTAAQQHFNGYYDVEMQIPLSVLGDATGNATKFRFNALRRTTHAATGTRVVLRAWPDAGDVYLMPIATLSGDGLKSKAETKQPTAARVLDKPATNKTQR